MFSTKYNFLYYRYNQIIFLFISILLSLPKYNVLSVSFYETSFKFVSVLINFFCQHYYINIPLIILNFFLLYVDLLIIFLVTII